MILQDYLLRAAAAMRAASFQDSPQLTLGDLIREIEASGTKQEDGKDKTVEFDFGTAIPTNLSSWRGSYAELALGYKLTGYDTDAEHMAQVTADALLAELKSAIGKTYCGWKGGDFTMSESTPVWIANEGNAGNTGIIGILDKGFVLILLTAYCEYGNP